MAAWSWQQGHGSRVMPAGVMAAGGIVAVRDTLHATLCISLPGSHCLRLFCSAKRPVLRGRPVLIETRFIAVCQLNIQGFPDLS